MAQVVGTREAGGRVDGGGVGGVGGAVPTKNSGVGGGVGAGVGTGVGAAVGARVGTGVGITPGCLMSKQYLFPG